MRTVTFESVLHGIAYRLGEDVRTAANNGNFLDTTAEALTEYIQTCYEIAWEYYPWPECKTVEQRTVDSAQLIDYAQSGQTVIGEMFGIYTRDPRKKSNPGEVPFAIWSDGFYVETANASATLWCVYRPAITAFTHEAYAAATAYVVGNTVFYPTSQASGTGDCYRCILDSTGNLPSDDTYWAKIPFMSILSEAVKAGAYSLALMEDGQHSTSVLPDKHMETLINLKIDQIEGQQQQPMTYSVATRAVPN